MQFFKKRKDIFRDEATNEVYLKRWNLFECKYFSIKIHQILLTDYDCFHDHPWKFISVILKGGYVEHRVILDEVTFKQAIKASTTYKMEEVIIKDGKYYVEKKISKIYHPFNILYRKAEDKHRLEIHQPCWSFVITLKKVREWGFWTKLGFVHWKDYRSDSSCE